VTILTAYFHLFLFMEVLLSVSHGLAPGMAINTFHATGKMDIRADSGKDPAIF